MKTSGPAEYDVVVLGGGPAGSSAAGFLAKFGYKVVLFEKERFPRYRIGESLLPATTLGILNMLGAKEVIEAQGFPTKRGGTFLWGSESEPWTFSFRKTSDIDKRIGGHAEFLHSYQVERAIFDDLLLRHVESLGVEVHVEHTFSSLMVLDDNRKLVRISANGNGSKEIACKYVIDASGRNSSIRSLFGERRYDPFFRNIAIYGYFDGGKRLSGDRSGNILTVAFKDGWFWYIPLSPSLTSVGLVLGREKYDELRAQGREYSEIYASMIAEAPMIEEFLEGVTPCTRAPYDKIRVDVDYSYIHSQFVSDGIFLVGDAACFIDPVFSSGVHLATYAGYLASTAINKIQNERGAYEEAVGEYEDLYRREYLVFHRFLTSFYQIHADHESYFWEARKVVGNDDVAPLDSFISIVTGTSTTGSNLFKEFGNFSGNVGKSARSLDTLVAATSGKAQSQDEVDEAKAFMSHLHESRRRLFKEYLDNQEGSDDSS